VEKTDTTGIRVRYSSSIDVLTVISEEILIYKKSFQKNKNRFAGNSPGRTVNQEAGIVPTDSEYIGWHFQRSRIFIKFKKYRINQ
jgi:hypothetical protein